MKSTGPPVSGRPYGHNYSACLSPDYWLRNGYKEEETHYIRLGESHRQSKESKF